MPYYPIFLDVSGKEVLVVGAGKVGLRKVRGLVESGALVTVVAPAGEAAMADLPVNWLRRRFRTPDVRDKRLVFAATDDRKVNRAVAAAAGRHGIPVNVADAPEECSFLVPARIRHENLQVAVSTSGRSPKLAVELKRKIEALLRGPQ